MNIVWIAIMVLSTCVLVATNPSLFLIAITKACQSAITLSLTLCGIYAFWLGIINIMDKSGLQKNITKLMSPLVNFLFKNASKETKQVISLNLACNFLGMGNACTPSGIKAISMLSSSSSVANFEVILFLVLNTSSLQFISTTIISLRSSFGSVAPANIFLPSLIATICSSVSGVLLCFLFNKIFKKRKKKN